MNRRGFLQSCIALAVAPAIVRADSLMRVVPRGLILEDVAPWTVPGAIIRGRKFVLAKPALFADGVSIIGCEFVFPDCANNNQAVIVLGKGCSMMDSTITAAIQGGPVPIALA